jgi:predicted P-loop ATPase
MKKVIGTLQDTLDLACTRLGISVDDLLNPKKHSSQLVTSHSQPSRFQDHEIIEKARNAKNSQKFIRLFDHGDPRDYGNDDSRADMALAAMLAFYTGESLDQLERLMRQSKLVREKWDIHPTYLRERTLTQAIQFVAKTGFYGGPIAQISPTPAVPKKMQVVAPTAHAHPVAQTTSPPSLTLITTRRGVVDPVVSNVVEILCNDPILNDLYHFDEFARQRNLNRPIPHGAPAKPGLKYPRRWTDADTIDVQIYIQKHHIDRVSKSVVEDALTEFDCRVVRHPVQEYLEALNWDGTCRLDSWLIEYLNADTSCTAAILETIGAKFLISAVARVMQPGCKADHVLVLEGQQGIGKSRAAATLAGESWFTDGLPRDLGDKDAAIHLQGRWIIELGELSQLRKNEIETVKSFISRQTDKFRPPFGRVEVEVPRQCVFIGTTNEAEYLVDVTGNRRFWPVRCGRIDLAALARDRDQLWAEAVHRYQQGEYWYIEDTEIQQQVAEEVARRTVSDPWLPHVAQVLMQVQEETTPGEVLQQLADLKLTDYSKGVAARVANIMRDLGWVQSRRDRKRGQLYRRGT